MNSHFRNKSGAMQLIAYAAVAFALFGCGSRANPGALVKAARNGNTNQIRALLAKGVPVDAIEPAMLRQTALAAAAARGDLETVGFLLKSGADPNLRSGRYSTTPLIEAIAGGESNLPVIELLLRLGARLDVSDTSGNLPLDYAKARADKRLIDFLVAKGAASQDQDSAKPASVESNAIGKAVPFKVIVR